MATIEDGKDKEAIVVGGSLSGLMNGIVLRRAGFKVLVLERSRSSALHSEAAGLGLAPNVHAFIETFIPNLKDYGVVMTESEVWNEQAQLEERTPLPYPMRLTNWKTIYDVLKNTLLEPKADLHSATYRTCVEVVGVREEDASVLVRYRDLEKGVEEDLQASLVIAADGANSIIRRILWPGDTPKYAGYVLWRGRVPDTEVSNQTKEALRSQVIFQHLKNGYILSYYVPAETEQYAQDPEHQYDLFWACYDVVQEDTPQFRQTMTDVDGNIHRSNMPTGKIQPAVWQEVKERLKLEARPFYGELVEKTTQLYVSAVRDFPNTRAVFLDGKVVLSGEALSQCRPHAGGGTNELAFQALELAKVLRGESTWAQWEELCLQSATNSRAFAIEMGKRHLPPGTIS